MSVHRFCPAGGRGWRGASRLLLNPGRAKPVQITVQMQGSTPTQPFACSIAKQGFKRRYKKIHAEHANGVRLNNLSGYVNGWHLLYSIRLERASWKRSMSVYWQLECVLPNSRLRSNAAPVCITMTQQSASNLPNHQRVQRASAFICV